LFFLQSLLNDNPKLGIVGIEFDKNYVSF